MQIIEINEPEKSNLLDQIVVGIDFGTTNSLVAYSKNHSPQILKILGDQDLLPSVISYDDQHDIFLVGKNRDDKGSISSIKRLLAKSHYDIQSTKSLQKILSGFELIGTASNPKLKFKNKEYSFPELASQIFLCLKRNAESQLGKSVTKAVVSVPAYFDNASRGAVLLAAKIAGLEVLRLIAEPTAAAYSYGFHKKTEGAYMVYDLGGGTFDISILNMQMGVLQVIATGGDNLLGGDDFDSILAEHIVKKLNIDLTSFVYSEARRLKEMLSTENHSVLNMDNHSLEITRTTFEKLILPLIDSTIKIAKNTLSDAVGIKLDGIILVGGATRIPCIKTSLEKTFEVKVFSEVDPDKAVVIGTALQAENLSPSSSKNSLLIDVLPLSVGLELYGGISEKIIMRNTPIPFSISKSFTTQVDNQTGIRFHVIQGEREVAKDCKSLAHFELKNIPAMKAGNVKIEVTFTIDADGILSINAKETTTGMVQSIELKPSYGLNQTEINDTLEEAFKNSKKDYKTRLLMETKIDARKLIEGIKKATKEMPGILDSVQKKNIAEQINSLQKAIKADKIDLISLKIIELNKLTANFIEKCLDTGAQTILKGRSIDDI